MPPLQPKDLMSRLNPQDPLIIRSAGQIARADATGLNARADATGQIARADATGQIARADATGQIARACTTGLNVRTNAAGLNARANIGRVAQADTADTAGIAWLEAGVSFPIAESKARRAW
jgi:hypothetical protein